MKFKISETVLLYRDKEDAIELEKRDLYCITLEV